MADWKDTRAKYREAYFLRRIDSGLRQSLFRLRIPARFSKDQIIELVIQMGYCPMLPESYELDHIYPVNAFQYLINTYGRITLAELDILNSPVNLQWLTKEENNEKSGDFNDAEFEDWLLIQSLENNSFSLPTPITA